MRARAREDRDSSSIEGINENGKIEERQLMELSLLKGKEVTYSLGGEIIILQARIRTTQAMDCKRE